MPQLQSFYQIEIVPIPVLRNEKWMAFPSMLYIFTSVPLPSIGVLLLKNQSGEGEGDRKRASLQARCSFCTYHYFRICRYLFGSGRFFCFLLLFLCFQGHTQED